MDRQYRSWHNNELVPRFFDFVLVKYGDMQSLADIMSGKPIVSRHGINPKLKADFEEFIALKSNKDILQQLVLSKFKFFDLKNVCNMPLMGPVNHSNNDWMIKSYLRPKDLEISKEVSTSKEKALLKKLKSEAAFTNKVTWANKPMSKFCKVKFNLKYPKLEKEVFQKLKSTIVVYLYENDINDYIKSLTSKKIQILKNQVEYV